MDLFHGIASVIHTSNAASDLQNISWQGTHMQVARSTLKSHMIRNIRNARGVTAIAFVHRLLKWPIISAEFHDPKSHPTRFPRMELSPYVAEHPFSATPLVRMQAGLALLRPASSTLQMPGITWTG